MKANALLTLLGIFWSFLSVCQTRAVPTVVYVKGAKGTEYLAAQELQRYLYVSTGHLPAMHELSTKAALPANSILVVSRATLTNPSLRKIAGIRDSLQDDAYLLKSLPDNRLLIVGGSETGALYGTYQFLQTMGIGFALHGDNIPDAKLKTVNLSNFNKRYTPSFALRGIQPFHDFPEGPDWWNEADYKAIIAQLPKMGMNFIGFHTYPEKIPFNGFYKAEPLVWIGTQEDFDSTGTVRQVYPVLHANTLDSTWGYYPKKTADFSFGASQLFETDTYGADYMKGISPWPHTDDENRSVFNQVGTLLNHSFSLANKLGVKTCLGTETPLTIPASVQTSLRSRHKDPASSLVKQALYEGIFSRIMATHPLDYFWLWTPEDWTWKGENDKDVDKTVNDLRDALAAAKKVNAHFTLATCGWVLGPTRDRAEFDRILPKEMPFGVINREQGFTPVEPAFQQVLGRPKWEISWVEDDPALSSPQFWAGRVLKDAVDAYKYGCTGFMGIHWRTQVIAPALLALAKGSWEAAIYTIPLANDARDYPVADLYHDWTVREFGQRAAEKLAPIFISLDGGPLYVKGKVERKGHFPRPSDWGVKGPGAIQVNSKPWSEVEKEYAFIRLFDAAKPLIDGPGNQERYDYWLNNFYYTKAQSRVGCLLGELESLRKQLKMGSNETTNPVVLAKRMLVVREQVAQEWTAMVGFLLQTVNTTGELGTLANLEQNSLGSLSLLTKHDSLLAAVLKTTVPAMQLSKVYRGPSRLVMTTKQALLLKGDDLTMKVRVLTTEAIESATLFWKPLGQGPFSRKPLRISTGMSMT